MLEARGVTVRAGTRELVARVSLALSAGTITAVAGPIGAGKSTLIRVLAGLVPAAEGEVLFEGTPLAARTRREVAGRIAVVFQESAPIEGFRVRDVIGMGRHPWIDPWRGPGPRDAEVVEDSMRRTGTAHLADRVHATLSGGEKQLVQLARALAQEPRVILLDEPAANLDLRAQWLLGERIRELAARGLAVLFSSHDLALVRRLGRRVILLRQGSVAAEGEPADVLQAARIAEVFDLAPEAVAGLGIR